MRLRSWRRRWQSINAIPLRAATGSRWKCFASVGLAAAAGTQHGHKFAALLLRHRPVRKPAGRCRSGISDFGAVKIVSSICVSLSGGVPSGKGLYPILLKFGIACLFLAACPLSPSSLRDATSPKGEYLAVRQSFGLCQGPPFGELSLQGDSRGFFLILPRWRLRHRALRRRWQRPAGRSRRRRSLLPKRAPALF